MDTIKDLVEQILILRDGNNPLYGYIKRPDILISGLKQLDELIGMKQLKETIIEIVFTYLLDSHKNSVSGVYHFCNYGEPGTGKTKAAKIIARIYYGLGLNEKRRNVTEPDSWRAALVELVRNFNSLNRNFNSLKEKYPKKVTTPRVSAEDLAWRDMEMGLSIANNNLTKTKNLINSFLEKQEAENTDNKNHNEDEADYLVVCGRNELVAKFSGQTAGLAYNFLLNNRGKTIIIEEAYSLYTGDKDIFGAETMVEINRFMDEFPGEISIGFNGYRKMLLKSIFFIQPGLSSRIRYHYNMDGYDSTTLSKIFTSQLNRLNITISSSIDLNLYFKNNIVYFNGYGRDTLTLANICKQVYTQGHFGYIVEQLGKNPNYKLDIHISYDTFDKAVKKYVESNLDEEY